MFPSARSSSAVSIGCITGAVLLIPALILPGCSTVPSSALSGDTRPSMGVVGVDPVAATSDIPHVVTSDIQAGIEAHVEEQTRLGGGFFPLTHEDETMHLKLVRVHTEYLANLGPRWHFACVDLADDKGDVYDVDFFLVGDPGEMQVTETLVHKVNGRPFFLWGQNDEGIWTRTPVDGADVSLMGVLEGHDHFEFIYHATLPQLDDHARLWLPIPSSDRFQQVQMTGKKLPRGASAEQMLTDQFGNRILYLELAPEHSGQPVELRYTVTRHEKSAYENDTALWSGTHGTVGRSGVSFGANFGGSPSDFLGSNQLVPVNDRFRRIAEGVVEGKDQNDLVRARALYDHTLDTMRYAKIGKQYGHGDANYACDSATGNCTDYHSYFIALARAVNIPARFAIGASIPSNRDGGGMSGYHCWAEFFAEGKWWPIDISEADKYDPLSTYYFGHHPANRIELSRGRDLIVQDGPNPRSGPMNFLAYPLIEVNGQVVKTKPRFGFNRLPH